MQQANRERFNVVQIEDPEVLGDLDAIAALEGIDMLFFGPADFSQGIGAPGQFSHPRMQETRKRVAEAAHSYGKFAGTVCSSEQLPEFAAMGYHFLCVGSDVTALGQAWGAMATQAGLQTKTGRGYYR